MDVDLEAVASLVREAGDRAAALCCDVRRWRKGNGSFVTEADEIVQRILREGLERLDPASGFLGEEEGGALAGPPQRYWAVDPIDGTESYLLGLPIWGVSAGLVIDGAPVAGVTYFPRIRELYWTDGERAFLNDCPLDLGAPPRPVYTWAVPSNAHRRYAIRLRGKLRSLGSTAYHVILVALGSVDGAILGRVHVWDVAGAYALAHIAGARLEDLDGVPRPLGTWLPDFLPPSPVLCARPEELLSMRRSIHSLAIEGLRGP
ncbi:MAG: inositol monophosphatase [Planctomycetes bacterium]|nr:inositol monophosphatase [Planctomycetota bacterium]